MFLEQHIRMKYEEKVTILHNFALVRIRNIKKKKSWHLQDFKQALLHFLTANG